MEYGQMMGDRWDAVMADLSRPRERMPVLNTEPREQMGGHKWHLIWERDGGVCWLCGVFVPKGTGEVDHMIPRSSFAVADLAIADRSDNLRTACQACNQAKSNFRPLSIRATVGVTSACWYCANPSPVDPEIDPEGYEEHWRFRERPVMDVPAFCGRCGHTWVPDASWIL